MTFQQATQWLKTNLPNSLALPVAGWSKAWETAQLAQLDYYRAQGAASIQWGNRLRPWLVANLNPPADVLAAFDAYVAGL
jgi:hypothetical protein